MGKNQSITDGPQGHLDPGRNHRNGNMRSISVPSRYSLSRGQTRQRYHKTSNSTRDCRRSSSSRKRAPSSPKRGECAEETFRAVSSESLADRQACLHRWVHNAGNPTRTHALEALPGTVATSSQHRSWRWRWRERLALHMRCTCAAHALHRASDHRPAAPTLC